jgi:glutamyl-tRNA synthetase
VNVLRVEDIDTPRVVRGAASRIQDDLRWLGLTWDEGPDAGGPYGPYVQSARIVRYADAIEALRARGLTYPCDCSRAEIAARTKNNVEPKSTTEASAPHGEELVYPGTCRALPHDREMKRPPALRIRIPDDSVVTFADGVAGQVTSNVSTQCGDFVLQRGDGLYAYHLAVSLDDLAMKITDVVRGRDLLSSTARQILLMRLLGASESEIPCYTHVPLVLGKDGTRLAKRDPRVVVRDLRMSGVKPEAILGVLAFGLGIVSDNTPRSAVEIARIATLPFSQTAFCYDDSVL